MIDRKNMMHKTNITGINNKLEYEGKMFGMLRVIEYINARDIVCECTCEKHTLIRTRKYRLDDGSVTSCGCISKHTLNKNAYEQICTDEFNVVEYINALNIRCICSCGKSFVTTKQHIDNNEVHSCGCRHHIVDYDKAYNLNKKGYLTIGKHIGYGVYECKCDCGNTCYRDKNQLDNTEIPSCGCMLHKSHRGITENKIESLEKIYEYILDNRDKTIQEIADAFNVSYSTIQKAVRELSVEEFVHYNDSVSNLEKELRKLIESYNVDVTYTDRTVIAPLELDIYIPSKKLAIEFNGNYWHSLDKKDKYYHRDKTFRCAQKGIQLLHIFEYEWNDTNKRSIIENILDKKLNYKNTVIYARNTYVKEIENTEYKEFCNKYHLQGYAPASIKIGCFYNNVLVGVMSFGTPRYNTEYEYELIRLCWCENVTGGAEKLLSYFIKKFNPSNIITYCNIAKFTGAVYTRLGFNVIGFTEPNYVWTKNKFNETYSRYQTQKHKLIEKGLGTDEQSEDEIMKSHGYLKIYDSGNIKLEWRK